MEKTMKEKMNYVVISDTHFGDPTSTLVIKNGKVTSKNVKLKD